jgi:hypothetical protein
MDAAADRTSMVSHQKEYGGTMDRAHLVLSLHHTMRCSPSDISGDTRSMAMVMAVTRHEFAHLDVVVAKRPRYGNDLGANLLRTPMPYITSLPRSLGM